MELLIKNYLEKVSKGLNQIPAEERRDILEEIRNHIYECLRENQSIDSILQKLGPSEKLAHSYVAMYHLNNNQKMDLKYVWTNLSFYFSMGIISVIVVPFLFLCEKMFFIIPFFIIPYSILGLFLDIPGVVYVMVELTGLPQFAAALIFSFILIKLSRLCKKGLNSYLAYLAKKYQRVRFRG